ncbi:unnamed protein product [Brachionus calyciflorus]|uniref:Uncharacterized protein n=1 Tax=Brachionus calyciflorus TaxID=104777 RepID=A0A814GAQ0_9BILA|nr:unnamed protein product [Brachionus calyciflorus]
MFYVRRLVTQPLNFISKNTSYLNQSRFILTSQVKQNSEAQAKSSNQSEPINLSEPCIKRIKEIFEADKKYLKVSVESGGCSGLNYNFSLETKISEEDQIIEKEI